MRKLLATLSLVLMLSFASQAQIVINEINYNNPSTDSLEFVELYNTTSNPINLSGYTIDDANSNVQTIGNITIPAMGYLVIATDSAGFENAFGITPAFQWNAGLNNGGDAVVLKDAAGAIVDSVYYDDVFPWPTSPDGDGPSLALCDAMSDNVLPEFWVPSMTASSVIIDGTDTVFATPGAANMVTCPPAPGYPLYMISQLRGNDANGVADSLLVTCEIRGIAYCEDFNSGAGYDFPFSNSDNQGGIRIYSGPDVSGYVHTAGDSLHIWGVVNQYNGLTQFIPDSIVVISQGNMAPMPASVSTVDESTENKYVEISGVHIVDTVSNTSSGISIRITTGSTDTILLRIDADASIYGQALPAGNFNVSGWGTQFDYTNPYNDYYQLLPCGIMNVTNTTEVENNSAAVKVFPNPTRSVLNIESDLNVENVQIHNTLGQLVLNVANINTNYTQINTADLENGIYIISIQTENRVMTQQFQVLK